MIKLQTAVEAEKSGVKISPSDRILILGSCFADNIGSHMKTIGMKVMVNPFGTLYNPASIASALRRLAFGPLFSEDECRMMGSGAGLVCSFSHHTSFARKDRVAFLENANTNLRHASDFFQDCNKLIITLGTSWCYRHIEDNVIVSNCLKRDAKEFVRERLGVGEIVSLLEEVVGIAGGGSEKDATSVKIAGDGTEKGVTMVGIAGNGTKEIIFTVSPIRHLKDGAHGNQLSKAGLLLAVDEICSRHGNCAYFPAYEIVMDELRDYRFYAEDMIHPSQQAVDYIWERFCEAVVPASEMGRMKEMERIFRQSRHRPNLSI